MHIRENKGKVAIVVVSIGLSLYASIQQTHQLRPDMPKEFADFPTPLAAEQRSNEERIAQAYWDCARNTIQWKYGFGSQLPHDPPPEFVVSATDLGKIAADPTTRFQFWQKLEGMWYLPDTWSSRYRWNFDWITNSVKSFVNKVQHYMDKLPRAS